MCVYPSQAIPRKLLEVIIVTLGTVTASDMDMHHVLSIWTFIQGHTDLNHENNKGLIISETIQAMPIKFAVKIVRLLVYNYDHCQSDDLDTSVPETWLLFNLQYLRQYLSYYIKTWHDGRPMLGIHAHASFNDFDLDVRS